MKTDKKREPVASYRASAKVGCSCNPPAAVLSRVSWRPWGGTKYKYRCQMCGKEWPKQ
jgi:hypothetical protein